MISAQEYALNAQGDFGKEKIAKVSIDLENRFFLIVLSRSVRRE